MNNFYKNIIFIKKITFFSVKKLKQMCPISFDEFCLWFFFFTLFKGKKLVRGAFGRIDLGLELGIQQSDVCDGIYGGVSHGFSHCYS